MTCKHLESRVIDTRHSELMTRRRRACECGHRWTTYEVEVGPDVIKKFHGRKGFSEESTRGLEERVYAMVLDHICG